MTPTKKQKKSMPFMAYEEQQQITRLCVRCGLLLMQYGAESAVVVDLTKRLGIALGVRSVECALSFNALTLTTLYNGRCITTTRDTVSQSINVNMLVQIQQIVSTVENVKINNDLIENTYQAFDVLDKQVYPPWLVAFFVGGSCGGFAYLNSGNIAITAVAFLAGMVAMLTRILLSKHYFNVFITVIITAFIASLIGATSYFFDIGSNADIAVASSVLLLVPSFPLINSLSDILKGYITIGLGRFLYTFMLTLSSCVGIVMALVILQIKHWGF